MLDYQGIAAPGSNVALSNREIAKAGLPPSSAP